MSRQDKEAGNDREVVDELPPVPCDFFMYCGSAKAEGNSMYRCLKCENLYFEFNILIYCRLQSVTHCQLT